MSIAAFLTLGIANIGTSEHTDDYAAAVAAVEEALVEVNTDPATGVATLRAALDALHGFAPQLAGDPEALELRTIAELALARAELAGGDREAAAATLDATLEGLAGAPLPIERLGPSLGALVEERQDALAARGRGRLTIDCAIPCRVFVNERAIADPTIVLPLGEHRVWIAARDDAELAPLRTTLALLEPDAALTLVYPEPQTEAAVPGPALVGRAPISRDERFRRQPRRVAPRWAEATTLAVGGAALIAGAVLWAIDSTCPRGADPNDIVACPELYDTRTAGVALVSAGGVAALTGGLMLAVDEARVGDRRGRELALVWTTRF